MKDFLLSYDTVFLRPRYSTLNSRSNADTSVKFLGLNWRLPVIPANMKDVIGFENAKLLAENQCFYIMHRFDSATKSFASYCDMNFLPYTSVSLGINDESKKELEHILQYNVKSTYITIDVAHGHHSKVVDMVNWIKSLKIDSKLIVGNVATADGYKFLHDLNVDAIKVGIGGGSICTTKYKTGFHLPTLHSVYECANLGLDTPIIADGGAKHYGDIAKALRFGATMVMAGGWFASCIDSPAKIINGKKVYRGSTSYEAKGEHKHIEGRTLELEEGLTYEDRLIEIQQSLQSAISYAGGTTLDAFNHVDWDRVYPN